MLVTGGGRGIGRAIALALADGGGTVAVAARTAAEIERTAAEIRERGGEAIALAMDVTVPASVGRAVAALRDRGGALDVLVNNAGIGGGEPIEGSDESAWRRIIDTNLTGTYLVTREALPLMRAGGRVINMSSVLGRFGVPGYTAYCASKHGIIGFTRALALELAPRGITVNALCPGWVETEHVAAGDDARRRGHGDDLRRVPPPRARRGAVEAHHPAGGGRGARALPRVPCRVRHHRPGLQHLRRAGDELSHALQSEASRYRRPEDQTDEFRCSVTS